MERILTSSCYDADAGPLPNALGLKKVLDLVDNEAVIMGFKALTSIAPENLSDLFIRNSYGHLRPLQNTSTDLQLPKNTTKWTEMLYT